MRYPKELSWCAKVILPDGTVKELVRSEYIDGKSVVTRLLPEEEEEEIQQRIRSRIQKNLQMFCDQGMLAPGEYTLF